LPSKADIYAAALEGLARVDQLILMKDPSIPPLYASGVQWKAIKHDEWRRANQIAVCGWGDCEGLSCWRVAELRNYGEDPGAVVGVYHTGPKKYHAVVVRGDDSIEDPSVALGMRPRIGMPQTREQMNVINGFWPRDIRKSPIITVGLLDDDDSDDGGVKTEIIDNPDGTSSGKVSIPMKDGTKLEAMTSASLSKADAAAKTANLLADTANTIAKNPVLLAKLNPYTAAAVALYSSPSVRASLKTLAGQGKSLASKGASLLRKIF